MSIEVKDRLITVDGLKSMHDRDEEIFEKMERCTYLNMPMVDYSPYGGCPSGRWVRVGGTMFGYGLTRTPYDPSHRFYLVNVRLSLHAASGTGIATVRNVIPSNDNWDTSIETPYGTSLARLTMPISSGAVSSFNTCFVYDTATDYGGKNEVAVYPEVYSNVTFWADSCEIMITPISVGGLTSV